MGRFNNNNNKGRGGRGGRGNHRQGNKKNNNNNSTPTTKKKLEDYNFYIGSSKQAADFDTTKDFIINHIKKTYKQALDISESLELLEKYDTDLWKPTLSASKKTDADEKAIEDEANKILYKAEIDEWQKRTKQYKENLINAYGLIWERCAKSMKDKIQQRADYQSIRNDPIKLLQAIKEHSLDFSETKYEMATILDALKAYILCKQRDDESLSDYRTTSLMYPYP